MKTFIHLSLATMLFFSCKNNSPSASAPAAAPEPVATTQEEPKKPVAVPIATDSVQEEKMRVVVSFYSIGEGAESKFINAFEDSIGAFSLIVKKNIDYEKNAWGREGETDFCMRLNELSPAEQLDFISFTKETLKGAKWVNIRENYQCKHRRKK